MNDEHHDERYEDGDDSTGTLSDYVDWTTWETVKDIARNLRPGNVIVRNGRRFQILTVDNVDGFIEIQSTEREMFFARWSTEFTVYRVKASSTEQS
jgi:hypothetical protein